ncbi:hypothetical protein GDO81_009227 [Engystomops pustulosus]|uniref:Uncharacterized protein n=1 Tax=Engystomops pustulosus TaxID=76066 RepID=A0AAV7BPZ3_ENGPU|nr:hypothetical protein GDO81_009227 [Engystomops pustulosus]
MAAGFRMSCYRDRCKNISLLWDIWSHHLMQSHIRERSSVLEMFTVDIQNTDVMEGLCCLPPSLYKIWLPYDATGMICERQMIL